METILAICLFIGLFKSPKTALKVLFFIIGGISLVGLSISSYHQGTLWSYVIIFVSVVSVFTFISILNDMKQERLLKASKKSERQALAEKEKVRYVIIK